MTKNSLGITAGELATALKKDPTLRVMVMVNGKWKDVQRFEKNAHNYAAFELHTDKRPQSREVKTKGKGNP